MDTQNPRALRLKYGHIGHHAGELIPHLHRENTRDLELIENMTMETFVQWLQKHFPRHNA